MAVVPSVVASAASTYTPPFLGVPTSTSTSIAGPTGTSQPDPAVPAISDPHDWIAAYLSVHKLSTPSYRYAYLLWIVILFFGLVFACLHWTGFRGGFIGATFDKWAYRRRTWRKKHAMKAGPHKQPIALPSNAQLLALAVLFIGPLVLSFVGPDYIAPGTHLWDLTHNLTRRWQPELLGRDTVTLLPPQYTIGKSWWTSSDRLGLIAFALFPLAVLLSLKAPPFALFALPVLTSLHFDKLTRLHRWCGRLIYLLVVGHVVTWSIQLAKDKQEGVSNKSAWSFVFLYQDFIYAVIAFGCFTLLVLLSLGPIREHFYETFKFLHIILVPLTLIFSALHYPPLGAWCYIALGLWGGERLYRFGRQFWINGVFGTKKVEEPIGTARYHPPTPYTAGHEWQGEANRTEQWQMQQRVQQQRFSVVSDRDKPLPTPAEEQTHGYPPANTTRPGGRRSDESFTDSISEYYQYDTHPVQSASPQRPSFGLQDRPGSTEHSPGSSVDLMTTRPGMPPRGVSLEYAHAYPKESMAPIQMMGSTSRAERANTPAGFAHAVALPGRTVRLTLQTSQPLSWAPGQHVLLRVPALSRMTMHPFTIASCCDKEERSEMVLLIRARKGFTKKLWAYIQQHSGPGRTLAETLFSPTGRPKRGALLRATVDGPYGSSTRARWGAHSTMVIIVGGSGVSFGTAIMEYLCLCLRGRDGKTLGGKSTKGTSFKTDRIRFVWTVREYSHIQWAAPIIRRCLDMMPRNTLQVDIFVTNGISKPPISATSTDLRTMAYQSEVFGDDDSTLAPPMAQFAKANRSRTMSNDSTTSVDSAVSDNSVADLDYPSDDGGRLPRRLTVKMQDQEEQNILDITNFDYEDDTRLPGEAQLSKRVLKEGKVRRAMTRRVTAMAVAKELRNRPAEPQVHHYSPHDSPTKETPLMAAPLAPPSSYRPPDANRPPRSSYPLGHPGHRSGGSPTGSEDARQRAFSSADMYAAGVDPLQFGPPAPVRPARAQRTPIATPAEEAPSFAGVSGPLSDGWRYELPGVSQSSDTLNQYYGRYDEAHTRPSQWKRESTQSSLYTVGPQGSSVYGFDPNYDNRTVGAGESVRSLVDRKGAPAPQGLQRSGTRIDMDDDETDDLNVVSEMARPGRPRLDRILADEVERSHGAIGVACCGPASLNAMVRKIVAAQISPSRLLRGDQRGRVTLVTEDFEW